MAARRRAPKAQLRALIERVGVKALAKRLERKPQTLERWLSNGPPKAALEAVRESYERSERARLASELRRQRAEEKEAAAQRTRGLRAESARRGQATRRLTRARQEGPKYDGRTAAGHAALKGMIESEEPVWVNFLAAVEAEGHDKKEAFNRWYSPKLPAGLKGRKGLKKPKRSKKRKKKRKQ
jgi:hypothetical protein